MELSTLLWLVPLILGLGLANFLLVHRKVRQHFLETPGVATDLTVRWTLFGPWAPGRDNLKYRVTYRDLNGQLHEVYAVASLFGEVFVREE